MTQEKIIQEENQNPTKLSWERQTKKQGIFELLQPILSNFVLLVEEEKKRTLEKLERTKQTLEKVKNNK